MENIPLELDMEKSLGDPFLLSEWLEQHKDEIKEKGKKMMFEGDQQFQVHIFKFKVKVSCIRRLLKYFQVYLVS